MNILILGGGISGLLAAYGFRDRRPVLLEAKGRLGGAYTAGGLKYIRRTLDFERLLRGLDMKWSPHTPRGLVFAGGLYHQHPQWLRSQPAHLAAAIQKTHWRKTRGTAEGFRDDCMNDPFAEGPETEALRCDHQELIDNLVIQSIGGGARTITGTVVEAIEEDHVIASGSRWPYTWLFPTLPLGLLAKLAPWAKLPSARPRPLTVATFYIKTGDQATPSWDYMYTPTLPMISRIAWLGPGWFQTEAPGKVEPEAILYETKQALAIFADGEKFSMDGYKVIQGHLSPLGNPLEWPSNWRPLGRFAQWEPRMTAERVWGLVQEERGALR